MAKTLIAEIGSCPEEFSPTNHGVLPEGFDPKGFYPEPTEGFILREVEGFILRVRPEGKVIAW